VYATARSVEKMSGLDECIHRLALDVNSDDRVADVVSNIMEREGRIDILVNNAGIDSVSASASIFTRCAREVITCVQGRCSNFQSHAYVRHLRQTSFPPFASYRRSYRTWSHVLPGSW
jgi:NADP-dependent 3-hydroxy acid dehydrogenase YdfG